MADQLPDIDWDEFEDERDPFDTGGFVSVDFADDLGYLLEFEDSVGRRCQVAAADIVEAFLTLERDGRIPDVGEDWRRAMALSLFEADRFSCMSPARFKEMRYLEDGICFTCSAEGHGVFEMGDESYLIERSTIVTAVLSLVEMEALRFLPHTWNYCLRVAHEQICETWRHTRSCLEDDATDAERVAGKVAAWADASGCGTAARCSGLCPKCDGAMLLVNIAKVDPKHTPHGRHTLRPMSGFDYNLERILACTLFDPTGVTGDADGTFEVTSEACRIRETLVSHFDMAVALLQEDIGIGLRDHTLEKMLTSFFCGHWYCWPTASCGNAPWLMARTGQAFDLNNQSLRPNAPLTKAVLQAFPELRLGRYNNLKSSSGRPVLLSFGLRNHVCHANGAETLDLYVQKRDTPLSQTSELIFETTITLRTAEFLLKVQGSSEPTERATRLMVLAKRVHASYLQSFPDARIDAVRRPHGLNRRERA